MIGDLMALQYMIKLLIFNLAKMEVAGDIKALQHLKRMKALRVSDAKAGGDLRTLEMSLQEVLPSQLLWRENAPSMLLSINADTVD